MKIVDLRTLGRVMFGELEVGDLFEFDGDVFLRTETLETDCNEINCAKLDGELGWFSSDEEITPLNAELVLK